MNKSVLEDGNYSYALRSTRAIWPRISVTMQNDL